MLLGMVFHFVMLWELTYWFILFFLSNVLLVVGFPTKESRGFLWCFSLGQAFGALLDHLLIFGSMEASF